MSTIVKVRCQNTSLMKANHNPPHTIVHQRVPGNVSIQRHHHYFNQHFWFCFFWNDCHRECGDTVRTCHVMKECHQEWKERCTGCLVAEVLTVFRNGHVWEWSWGRGWEPQRTTCWQYVTRKAGDQKCQNKCFNFKEEVGKQGLRQFDCFWRSNYGDNWLEGGWGQNQQEWCGGVEDIKWVGLR